MWAGQTWADHTMNGRSFDRQARSCYKPIGLSRSGQCCGRGGVTLSRSRVKWACPLRDLVGYVNKGCGHEPVGWSELSGMCEGVVRLEWVVQPSAGVGAMIGLGEWAAAPYLSRVPVADAVHVQGLLGWVPALWKRGHLSAALLQFPNGPLCYGQLLLLCLQWAQTGGAQSSLTQASSTPTAQEDWPLGLHQNSL